jgi:hypothetical protein
MDKSIGGGNGRDDTCAGTSEHWPLRPIGALQFVHDDGPVSCNSIPPLLAALESMAARGHQQGRDAVSIFAPKLLPLTSAVRVLLEHNDLPPTRADGPLSIIMDVRENNVYPSVRRCTLPREIAGRQGGCRP